MKCRGGRIINDDSVHDHDVYLYMTCDIVMNMNSVDEVIRLMHDEGIDVLIIGSRGQYDRCSHRLMCKSGIVSRCYSMNEVYAVLSVIDMDAHFKKSKSHMMDEIMRSMTDTHCSSDVVPGGTNVRCVYPCIAHRCPRVIKSSSDLHLLNNYVVPDKLTSSSIDPVYYFFATVLVVVILLVLLAVWFVMRRNKP